MLIEDGKGSGSKLEVKDYAVRITSGNPSLDAAKRGDGYVLVLDSVTTTTADHLMALIINKDGKGRDLVVTHFNLRANSPDSGATSFYEVNLGGTFTHDIANSTATLPRNLRSGNPSPTNICGAECYICDGVGDMTTEANAYIGYRGPRTYSSSFLRGWVEGGWVVPYGQSFSISAGHGDVFRGTIQFFFCEN